MIRISLTQTAYETIAVTLPWGTIAVEPQRAQNGDVWIWLDEATLNRLKALRGPGKSYSDVILWVAASEG